MDSILIPGFWLDATSWDEIVAALAAAGHIAKPLTLPGLERNADRVHIGVVDHVNRVVDAIDHANRPVALVGHSGGGPIAHAAVDARPEQVARVVYVDSGPLPSGASINDAVPVVDGDVPLPAWSQFSSTDLRDLTDEMRSQMRSRAIPEPTRVTREPIHLKDPRRSDVPVTVIATTLSSDQLRELMAADHPYVQELRHVRQVNLVDLRTGHWPQFTRPTELSAAIVTALES